MFIRSNISILGLYYNEETLFDELHIPEGISSDTLKDLILLECGELEVLYPDATFMKSAIKVWSDARFSVWSALWETMHYEYNPIWNKDGTYTETETQERDLGTSNTRTLNTTSGNTRTLNTTNGNTRTLNTTNGNTRTLNTNIGNTRTYETDTDNTRTYNTTETQQTTPLNASETDIKSVAGFNEDLFHDAEKHTITRSGTTTVTDGTTGTVTDAGTQGGTVTDAGTQGGTVTDAGTQGGTVTDAGTQGGTVTDAGTQGGTVTDVSTDDGTITISRTRHEQGNIGVTTTQQMIREEREISEFNLYQYIVKDFKDEFCIAVY